MSGFGVNLRKEFGRQCFTTVGFMKAWQEFDHYDEPRPHCAVTSSKWDLRTALVSSALQTIDIVRVKLDSLCRGELNHSNVPYSRF
uniref:Uncharacterized protein n=1 Tax=Oryza glumipatula TaxID=40148 RepID=A0A0D9YGQ0_9ORYZ